MNQGIPILTLTARAPAGSPVLPARCVGFDGALIAARGAKVLGIADYGAEPGALYGAVAVGTAPVEAGAAIALGDNLTVDAQGRAIPATEATDIVFGDALEAAAAAGAYVEVLLRR